MFSCCCSDGSKTYYQVETMKNGKRKIQYTSDIKKADDYETASRIVRIEKSEYQELMKNYTGNKKWTDPTFPPGSKSLGKIEGVPQNVEWRRISEIIPNARLFDEKIEPKDVIQGSLGDCYFLSAVAALSERQGRIAQVFGDQQFNPNGIYKVQLRVDGIIKQVLLDDYVPVNSRNKPLFCQPNKQEFWVIILEKAWAKVNGSYGNIAHGSPHEVLKAITYAPGKFRRIKQQNQINNPENPKSVWKEIKMLSLKDMPMCTGTKDDPSISWDQIGLVSAHAYTLLDAKELYDYDNNVRRMVKLRNPWGHKQWKGEGNENDYGFWDNIKEDDKRQFRKQCDNGNDGIFFMTYEQFCHYFNEVHLSYLLPQPMYQVQKMHSDKKHGSIYSFLIKQTDDYTFQLHQDTIRGQIQEKRRAGLNRSTLLLAQQINKGYRFVNGSLKYFEEDNSLSGHFQKGRYYLYAKVDPTVQGNMMPQNLSISSYSKHLVDIQLHDQKKHPQFFQKLFLEHARTKKREEFDGGNMWISYKLLYEKGGYAYIAFGVEAGSQKKFLVTFDQADFNNAHYILKKPHKGKGKQTIQINPGEEKIIVARVKNGQVFNMKFPPPIDIERKRV